MTNFAFLKYIDSNKEEFLLEVSNIANRLGITSNQLLSVMFIESNLNHKAPNRISGAVGLIQFMPATAISLGTTVQKLALLTNVQQLYYVEKYLKPYAGKMHTLADVYFAVFFPLAIGKADNFVLKTSKLSAKLISSQNKAYDRNNDNEITVGEVKISINKRIS